MMKVKIVKTESDYEKTVARIEELMEIDDPIQDVSDELELLAMLVDLYEEEAFPINLPSPVDAIRFRMDQQGMKQADLVPYFGSKSKVSEVLSGKRQLSLSMIRKLHAELGIPAEVLLREPGAQLADSGIDWLKFPIAEMRRRGWFEGFSGSLSEAKSMAEELISVFATPVGLDLLNPVYQRATENVDRDGYALAAWQIRVCRLALDEALPRYTPGTVTSGFVHDLVRLSYLDEGPVLAKEYLNKNGIHLIIEKHLPKTHLDGASMFIRDRRPLVALTLRHDRLDSFWFTLCHELAHIALHLEDSENERFFDDLDKSSESDVECAADQWAADALINSAAWREAGFRSETSSSELLAFAEKLRISPSIPAGRLSREINNYVRYQKLFGRGIVRRQFAPDGW